MPAPADPVPVVALSDPSGAPTSITAELAYPDGSVTRFTLSPPDPEVEGERWAAWYSIDRDLAERPAFTLEPATVRQTRLRIEVEAVYQPVDRHGQPRTYYTVSNRADANLIEAFTSRFTRVLHRDRCVVGTEHEVQLLAERLAAAAYEAATGAPHPLAPLLEQIQRAGESQPS
jgi:hypothetical protein